MTKSISPKEFEKEIWALSKEVKRNGRIYNGSELNPIRLYRSRIIKTRKLPTSLDAYNYPPVEKCTLGRANTVGSQVFYSSAGAPTTFVESRCKPGDTIVIAEYRGYAQLLLQEIGYSNSKNDENEYETTIHTIFTYPDKDFYEYSSIIAAHLMSGDQLHGITYPSIISNSQSQNIAIKSDYADAHLHLIHCTAYRIKDVKDPYKYDVDEFDFGLNVDGKIQWKGRKKHWTIKENGAQLKMIANGWQWDAYDINDKLVDPV